MSPATESDASTVPVVLRWWNGRTTAYGHDAGRGGPLAPELTYDRGDTIGHFRFRRMQDGVFVFSQIH